MTDLKEAIMEDDLDRIEDLEDIGIIDYEEKRSKESDRRSDDRRSGFDRRNGAEDSYDGPERRKETQERRVDMERRRGPGKRRSDERRSAEEGEMNDEQFVFLKAIDDYKRINRRPFPSFTEILEIIHALGYRKVAEPQSIEEKE